ncbi:hypothetical protein [Cellulomonas massiliensis]|uniref:hypothetical protein n=1 Tax=Cellulomonas massiliensis TaxID=1465811 RepID=UPI00031AE5E7|nr:hypothetical protein [Cellulomonas massiliensis]
MPVLRRRLPSSQRSRLDLRPGDQVLVAITLTDGAELVATRRALHVLAGDEVARSPWSDVERGSLDPESRVLSVAWVWGTTSRLTFPDDRSAYAFTQTFKERVQQSVVHARSVPLPGGRTASVAVRRDEEGELFVQVTGATDADLQDASVARAVDAAEREVREAVGLPG